MPETLRELVRRADTGERFAVCVLAKTTGSTPQKAGAMMLVRMNGQTLGTIGGGCVEAEVCSEALRRLARPTGVSQADSPPSLLRFPLDRDYGWDDGLVCGGVMFVTLQLIENRGQAQPWRIASQALADGQPAQVPLHVIDEHGEPTTILFERKPDPQLIIAGAGHVGQALAHIAGPLGFAVTVVDDRADAASAERFPDAHRIVGPIDRKLAHLSLGDQSYVVIVTRGHRHDGDALAAVVGSNATYVGLIGSRRKTLAIFERLLDQGVPPEQLGRIRSPIGLRIGAVSPAEIAVSIAAELVACRRGAPLPVSQVMKLESRHLDRVVQHTPAPKPNHGNA